MSSNTEKDPPHNGNDSSSSSIFSPVPIPPLQPPNPSNHAVSQTDGLSLCSHDLMPPLPPPNPASVPVNALTNEGMSQIEQGNIAQYPRNSMILPAPATVGTGVPKLSNQSIYSSPTPGDTTLTDDLSQERHGNLLRIVADMFMQQSELSRQHAMNLKEISNYSDKKGDGSTDGSSDKFRESNVPESGRSYKPEIPSRTCASCESGSTSDTFSKENVMKLAKKSYESMLEMQKSMDGLLNHAMIQSFRTMSDNHYIGGGGGSNDGGRDHYVPMEENNSDDDDNENITSILDPFSTSNRECISPSSRNDKNTDTPRKAINRERDNISSDSDSDNEEEKKIDNMNTPREAVKRERDCISSSGSDSEDEKSGDSSSSDSDSDYEEKGINDDIPRKATKRKRGSI